MKYKLLMWKFRNFFEIDKNVRLFEFKGGFVILK